MLTIILLMILGIFQTSQAACTDSTTFVFYQTKDGVQRVRRCQWLTAKAGKELYRINKFCKQVVNGTKVREECQKSCSVCVTDAPSAAPTTPAPTGTCADSTTFTFDTYKNGVAYPRKCTWLTNRKPVFRTGKFCNGDVLTNCPSSCDNC